jgi:paraquat-inducible protein A
MARFNQALADPSLEACPACDLLQRVPAVSPGSSARCPRCGVQIWRPRNDSLNRSLALTIAAAVLYLVSNLVPMLGLAVVGRQSYTTILGGAQKLWANGMHAVAILVLFAAVLAPALQIGFLLLVLLGCMKSRPSAWVGKILRHVPFARTWSMIEVMLLGVMIALTKIAELATVIPGLALFSAFGLVVLLAAIQSTFDPREVWTRVEWVSRPGNKSGGGA